jgi:hypothetical protein
LRARRARWIAGVLLLVVAAPVAWYATTQPLVTPRGAAGVGTGSPAKGIAPDYLKEGSPAVGSYTFPVALDTKQEVARAYKLAGVPASFFVDRAGVIRAVQPGAMNRQTMLDRLRTVLDVAS